MSTPPYVAACLMVIASAYVSDRYKCRGYVNAFNYFVAIIGFIVLETTKTPAARYFGTFLVAMGAFPGIAISIAWNSNNIRGSPTKRAVGIAIQNQASFIGAYNIRVSAATLLPTKLIGHLWPMEVQLSGE